MEIATPTSEHYLNCYDDEDEAEATGYEQLDRYSIFVYLNISLAGVI